MFPSTPSRECILSSDTASQSVKPGSLKAWLAATRPKTFGIALAPVIVGISLALSITGSGHFWIGVLTAFVAVAVQALSNMENDVGYTKRKAERSNRKGLPRATSEGWLSIKQVETAIWVTGIAVICMSAALVAVGGWVIFILGALSVSAAYLYMGGPKPIAYTCLGELMVFIFFGVVAVNGTFYLQTSSVSWVSFVASCACGSIAASVLAVNNWRDLEHDASVQRKTLAVTVGKKRFPCLFLLMVSLPYLAIMGLVAVRHEYFPYLLCLLAARRIPALFKNFKTLRGYELNATMFGCVKMELEFAFLLSAGALMSAAKWL